MARLQKSGCRTPLAAALVVGVGLLAGGASRSAAADTETRDFTVLVDDKPAGTYHMVIQRQDDGTVVMTNVSEVRVKVVGISFYSYTYRGRETWKDGRLLRLDSNGQENSKTFVVSAVPEAGGLRVTHNGQAHPAHAEVWTMTYWQLPPAPQRDGPLWLLGCDNGQEVAGRLQYLGTAPVPVAGQEQTCTHYRVTGSTPHELWYDTQERMVRQEWVMDGHRTALQLTRVGK